MPITRRRFLKQTFGFSAAALLSSPAGRLLRAAAQTQSADSQACHVLAVGDYGVKKGDLPRQKAVGDAMVKYARLAGLRTQALLMLGDNFYGGLEGKGPYSPRWETNVDGMYPAETFTCPMYAMLGNHDYSDEGGNASVAAQLAYAAHTPATRWKLPAKWYRFELPGKVPLASCLVLDTNFGDLSDAEQKEQARWLTAELAKPRIATWLFVLGHHPVFSDGTHGDTKKLVSDVEPLLRQYKVNLYLGGHDHDLQHIEFDGHPTSFIVSGAGGARAREVPGRKRSVFGKAVYGFTHLELSPDRLVIRHIDANNNLLHAFSKTLAGHVSIDK